MLTVSMIKADTGGFVGHSSVHPAMVDAAVERVERARGSLLIDGQVATCGAWAPAMPS
jgi:fructose 1,6-bisphosphate aldolase/phosphatase